MRRAFVCQYCGAPYFVDDGESPYHCDGQRLGLTPQGSEAPPLSSECPHRGETLRSIPCKPCSGRREEAVYSCALHGECTIRKVARGLASCWQCEDLPARIRGEIP